MSDKARRPKDVSLLSVTNLAEAYKHYYSLSDESEEEYDEALLRFRKAARNVTLEHIRDCRQWLERNVD